VAISARKWGRRGTPPVDIAPKRELYVHHTVTSNRRRGRTEQRRHMRELEQLHLSRGFLTIGYSFVLFPSGRLYEGRGPRALPAAQGGHNSSTIANRPNESRVTPRPRGLAPRPDRHEGDRHSTFPALALANPAATPALPVHNSSTGEGADRARTYACWSSISAILLASDRISQTPALLAMRVSLGRLLCSIASFSRTHRTTGLGCRPMGSWFPSHPRSWRRIRARVCSQAR
jgi:hypothetical protein